MYGSGRKKQKSCGGFCKEWREKVNLNCLVCNCHVINVKKSPVRRLSFVCRSFDELEAKMLQGQKLQVYI